MSDAKMKDSEVEINGDTDTSELYDEKDVFGPEEGHAIKYKTLSWQLVAVLMIAEIVSNGMFSIPYAYAQVGIIPGNIVTAFLGVFATYTAWLLIRFKLRHPDVHTMGDAGYILAGVIGREVLSFGTLVFAVFATGSQLLAGELALMTLSEGKLCYLLYVGIFAAATLLCSFPRTFDRLSWLSVPAVICIIASAIIAMVGAALHPVPNTQIALVRSSSFYTAFSSVTNPVFAYAGHFMFFSLVSEMKHPEHAMRAAYVLQGGATTLYVVFSSITYVFLGPAVLSPSLLSLPPVWAKAAFGVALPNFLIAGALYSHLAAKLVFVRMFRNTQHLHENTVLGWGAWTVLILIANGSAFVLTVGVPIFNYLVGLAASLFAAWYTYGIAGGFFLYDAWHGQPYSRRDSHHDKMLAPSSPQPERGQAWRVFWLQTTLSFLTILGGAVICVAGCYVSIRGIVEAYASGAIQQPFQCASIK